MGIQKQKWTQEEEEALRAGVHKHGPGKWKNILVDAEFAPFLTQRSNIDLKDKWRNLCISSGVPVYKDKESILAISLAKDDVNHDPSKTSLDAIASPSIFRYKPKILEALSTLNDPRGSDFGDIASFIEVRHGVPLNFRRSLHSAIRKLEREGNLEKVEKRYKIKDAASETNEPAPKQKDVKPRPSPISRFSISRETLEEAARTAACMIAEAENKLYMAAEANEEAERVSSMAEDAEYMLQIAEQIYEQCSKGTTVQLP